HRSKGDKKSDGGSASSVAPKKTWAASAGLNSLQHQPPARTGSHPQIRHLALESHEGRPVTKATMDEIRRDASSDGSNLQINTFSLSVADITSSRNAGPASAPLSDALVTRNSPAVTASRQSVLRGQIPRAIESVPLPPFLSRPTTAATTPMTASASADFPPRTTSAVLMSAGLPPRIDTNVAAIQNDRMQLVKSMSADIRDPTSAFTEDSDASLVLGASANDHSGFDSPLYFQQSQQQQQQQQPPSPPVSSSSVSSHHSQPLLQTAEGNSKRVISDKIKKLAHRFSNSSLNEKPESPTPPSAPHAVRRRPSNSPSVSERVFLFDSPELQTSSDPRISIFGKFGMASSQDDSHSRSSSIAAGSAKPSALPSLIDPTPLNVSGARQSTRRPQSMVHDPALSGYATAAYDGSRDSSHNSRSSSRCNYSDAGGRSSTRRTTVSGASASPNISIRASMVDPVKSRGASRGSRISGGSSNNNTRRHSLRNSPQSISLISGQDGVGLDDSSDDEENPDDTPADFAPAHGQHPRSISDIDHQPTITAGVQLSFPQFPSAVGSPGTNTESSSLGYRGVRNDGLGRRRGSIRAAFYASDEGLHIETAPSDPTGISASATSNTSSVAASPTGTRTARPVSFRRAGAVVPMPTSATIPDIQRSLSSSGSHATHSHPPGRNRSLSQTPTPRSHVLPVVATETRRLNEDDLHHNTDSVSNSSEVRQRTRDSLVSKLKCKSACVTVPAGCGYLDDVLVRATNADIPPDELGDNTGQEGGSYSMQARLTAASMAVENVFKSVDASKVLSSAEYERYSLEAASLKARLQSARTRLALEVRMRDTAKNLADLHRGNGVGMSMFKGKSSHQTHVDEYNQANEKVQQAEVDITELSGKLRLLESSIHGHQLAVLSSAVRTLVSESAHASEQTQVVETAMSMRVASLEKQIAESRSAHTQETERLASGHSIARQELEQQIRDLQNKNHEAVARFASKDTDNIGAESQLSRHSTGLAVERLAGEITVLKEQNRDAEQLTRNLEARLDEAHLKTQETQNALDELRIQASDVAEISRAKLESAMDKAHSQGQCIQAFVTGLRSIVGPLRVLGDVQDSAEKLRSFNSSDLALSQTPPATPTLRMDSAPSKETTSAESLESCLAGSTNGDLNAGKAVSAMSLISAKVSSCSSFYQEAIKVYESCARLQKELSTEKRLREAQGLAISQQREKLGKANYLAESADQRVKEATESLLAEHANEKKRWSEERQRLFDNIERLTQDINSLKSVDAALSSGNSRLQPLDTTLSSEDVVDRVAGSIDDAAVGKIEDLASGEPSEDLGLEAELNRLRGQVLELYADIASAKQQLQAKIDENNALQEELSTLRVECEQISVLESRIEILQNVELDMRKQLAKIEPLKQAHGELSRMLAEASHKGRNGASFRLTRCRSLTSLASLRRHAYDGAFVDQSGTSQQKTMSADAQTMTDTEIRSSGATTDEEVSQMLMAYSEKLVLKEDALHTREDELEAVRTTAAEIGYVLQDMLTSTEPLLQSAASNGARSAFNECPSPPSASWSPAFSAQLKPNTRNRSASFFQGLRTNYMGMVDGSDMPLPAQRAQTSPQRPASMSISDSASRPSPPGRQTLSAARANGCNDVPLFVNSLIPLSRMAAAEVDRLRAFIGELENRSHTAHMELRKTEERLTSLQKHCELRSKHEDAVQEDVAHVLGQISRLRTKVVRLENEKTMREEEARKLDARCRELENISAEQVLQLIVDRVGKREPETNRQSDDSPSAINVAAQTNGNMDRSSMHSSALRSKHASMSSTVTISHPEAGDIRAEFNELLHQIIARRDEDIERIQAVADAWRIDARKAVHSNEQRIWNTCTRGTQTVQTDQ
ncbi:hypothetical protein LPJ59_002303, partial [Coemansia sp. RSA 2399]